MKVEMLVVNWDEKSQRKSSSSYMPLMSGVDPGSAC